MGQRIYYHNLTKGWFNENSYTDAAENSEPGDIIKFSERGCSLLFDLMEEDSEIESKGEYNWARRQFLNHFKEAHGEVYSVQAGYWPNEVKDIDNFVKFAEEIKNRAEKYKEPPIYEAPKSAYDLSNQTWKK